MAKHWDSFLSHCRSKAGYLDIESTEEEMTSNEWMHIQRAHRKKNKWCMHREHMEFAKC